MVLEDLHLADPPVTPWSTIWPVPALTSSLLASTYRHEAPDD